MKRLMIAFLLLITLLMGISKHDAFAKGNASRDGISREIRPNVPRSGTWS